MRRRPLRRRRSAEGRVLVPLPELPPAQRRAGLGVRRLRARRLSGDEGRDREIRFDTGADPARVLCQVRLDPDCESLRLGMETHFHIGAFDEPERLPPSSRHVFPAERLPWLHVGPS
jgi:hypothetical protein